MSPTRLSLSIVTLALGCAAVAGQTDQTASPPSSNEPIEINDNRKPAGQLHNGILTLKLEARAGKLYPETDKILVISDPGHGGKVPLPLNGTDKPDPVQLRVGQKYRIRLINITTDGTGITALLASGSSPVDWRAVAKDGADLPRLQAVSKPARQKINVGETHDFEFPPRKPGELVFELRGGEDLFVRMEVRVH